MEICADSKSLPEYNLYEEIIRSKSNYDETDFTLSGNNIQALKNIKKTVLYYEDKVLSLDEVLARVLKLYSEFVPYS